MAKPHSYSKHPSTAYKRTKPTSDIYVKTKTSKSKGNPFYPIYIRSNRRTVEPWQMTAYVNDIVVDNPLELCWYCTWSTIDYDTSGKCKYRLKFVSKLCSQHGELVNTYQ